MSTAMRFTVDDLELVAALGAGDVLESALLPGFGASVGELCRLPS